MRTKIPIARPAEAGAGMRIASKAKPEAGRE
jgi:hypothetical protein